MSLRNASYRITRFQSESVFLRMKAMYHPAYSFLFLLLQISVFLDQRFFLIGQGGGDAVGAGGGGFLGGGVGLQGVVQAAGELEEQAHVRGLILALRRGG